MPKIRILWINGPLDGAHDSQDVTLENVPDLWMGPHPSDPTRQVVIYVLEAHDKKSLVRRYIYDLKTTASENLKRCPKT